MAVLLYLKTNWHLRQAKGRLFSAFSSVETDSLLNSKLSEIRFAFDADKAKIFQFHNGGIFIHGRSMKKMSLTYMQIKSGMAPPNVNKLQNLPLSMFPNMICSFMEKRGVILWKAKDAPDAFIRSRHIEEELDTVMLTGLWEGVELIGFISLNWVKAQPNHIDQAMLISYATEVAHLLSR